jgi:hypothetical protein
VSLSNTLISRGWGHNTATTQRGKNKVHAPEAAVQGLTPPPLAHSWKDIPKLRVLGILFLFSPAAAAPETPVGAPAVHALAGTFALAAGVALFCGVGAGAGSGGGGLAKTRFSCGDCALRKYSEAGPGVAALFVRT